MDLAVRDSQETLVNLYSRYKIKASRLQWEISEFLKGAPKAVFWLRNCLIFQFKNQGFSK